jgi:hypothetical protein
MTPRFIPVLMLAVASSSSVLAAATSANAASKAKAKPAAAPKADDDDKPTDADATPADSTSSDATPTADTGDAPASTDADATPKPAPQDSTIVAEGGGSPVESPGQTYYGIGLRYRAVIVPKFMLNLFADGGRTVLANGIGPEFTIRKNAFEYDFSAWYTSYAMDPTPFKGSSDNAQAWELVQSKIKVLYLTADFVWSHDIVPEFAFNYGLGAGLGIVWGDLLRTQAYPGTNHNDSTGAGYLPCAAQGVPNPTFCGTDNNHYAGYTEPSWANGGSKPVVFPWLVLQTGLRYKPHRNFIARLDAGFGTSGFFLGLGADYGL